MGLWLMLAPAALGSEAYAAANDNLAGALIVTVAVISTAEVVRAFRFLNALIGIWFLLAPWALVGASTGGRWSDMICGAALILLTLPRGIVRERYGAWDTYVV